MRIAVIGSRGPAPGPDCVEKALREICPRLARNGHEIDVYSERNGRAFGDISGARLIRLPGIPLGFGEPSCHAFVATLASVARGYDVINFCAADGHGLFSLAAKLGLHRTVVSVHGLEPAPVGALSPVSIAARFADAVTVVSRRLERHFREVYGRQTIYIPYGLERATTRPDPRLLAAVGLEAEGYVLLADRLVHESGAHLAIAAANSLMGRCRLVVAETGEGDAEFIESVRRQADPRAVTFLGRVEGALLDALIAHAYLYVLASLTEQTARPLWTALAHGRALVVSDLPEHLDAVGADGFTFTSGDAGDLRRVLAWLLDDSEMVARMQTRTAAAVTHRYSWDRIAQTYEQVFASIL